MTRVTLKSQEDIDLWSARDAVVLKALSLVLAQRLPFSKHCTHIKGYGGSKGAVRQVLRHLPEQRFVLKTDVQGYYASIDHQRLLDRLAAHITDRRVLNLIGQYLKRCAERGGLYWEYPQGIALGCPLSPIMGAFFLNELDAQLATLGLFFVRYTRKTVDKFVDRALRLYEQEPGEPCASSRLGAYVQRWGRWVQAGLPRGALVCVG